MNTSRYMNSKSINERLECVKCGNINTLGVPSCVQCSWPFSPEAWKFTTLKAFSVTIDTSCINLKQSDNNLNKLEEWASEGRITIKRSHALINELKGEKRIEKANNIDEHPRGWVLGQSILGQDTHLVGPEMVEPLKEIMFPTTHVLNPNQEYDIEHLRSHIRAGGDIFVTRDPRDFIVRGKKESLSNLGIWVFEPAEAVNFLIDLYGWSR